MRESFSNLLQKPWVIPVGVGLVSASAGFAGGYFYGRKKGVDDFIDHVSDNIDRIEAPTSETEEAVTEVQEKVSDVTDIPYLEDWDVDEAPVEPVLVDGEGFTKYNEIIEDTGYSGDEPSEEDTMDDTPVVVDEEPSPAPVRTHIFESQTDVPDWDYDREIARREAHPDDPCVIHADEFVRNDFGYMQETLTWYAGDDIVVDQNDTPIHNPTKLLGQFMENFGYGSNDKSVVYIRSTPLRREWEILLHTGSYTIEVLGLEIEESYEEMDLRHSSDRKFRDRD